MFTSSKKSIWHGFALAGVAAASIASAPNAFAGECPADKMKPNVRPMVDYKPVGVTDVVQCPQRQPVDERGCPTTARRTGTDSHRHRPVGTAYSTRSQPSSLCGRRKNR